MYENNAYMGCIVCEQVKVPVQDKQKMIFRLLSEIVQPVPWMGFTLGFLLSNFVSV